MSVETDLIAYLKTQTPVTDLVSTRIYMDTIPQGVTTRPALVVRPVSCQHGHTLTAASGHADARIQIDIIANSRVSADAVSEAIRGETHGYSGTWNSTRTVHSCQFDATAGQFDLPFYGDEAGSFSTSVDLLVMYLETVPTF